MLRYLDSESKYGCFPLGMEQHCYDNVQSHTGANLVGLVCKRSNVLMHKVDMYTHTNTHSKHKQTCISLFCFVLLSGPITCPSFEEEQGFVDWLQEPSTWTQSFALTAYSSP